MRICLCIWRNTDYTGRNDGRSTSYNLAVIDTNIYCTINKLLQGCRGVVKKSPRFCYTVFAVVIDIDVIVFTVNV